MKKVFIIMLLQSQLLFFSSFNEKEETDIILTVTVSNLRNSKGEVQFALYNRDDAFPDEHFTKTYRKISTKIENGVAEITFKHLSPGTYAISVLHDENRNGKIDKKYFLPVEGIGFSNYSSIGLGNKPTFGKASFSLKSNFKIYVKMIYL